MGGYEKERDYAGPPMTWWRVLIAVGVIGLLGYGCWGLNRVAYGEGALTGVASVIDGDTIEIHSERVRLSGIDAPERGRRCTTQAGATVRVYQSTANALSSFIANRTVRCERSGTDNHDRTVATCYVGGTDLGRWMVENGHAWDWPRYSKGKYASAEGQARAARRGLWAMNCPGLLGNRKLN